MNPDGQKSVKDLFNGAAGVHGDIEQWRSAPHSAVTPKMPGFSPKQFKLTGFSCTTLHPKQVALLEWPWRAFFFLLTFFVAGRDWIRFGASARYLKVLSVALQPDGFPSAGQTSEMSLWLCREPRSFFFGLEGTTLCSEKNAEVLGDVGWGFVPKSMDPSQRSPLSQNFTEIV